MMSLGAWPTREITARAGLEGQTGLGVTNMIDGIFCSLSRLPDRGQATEEQKAHRNRVPSLIHL